MTERLITEPRKLGRRPVSATGEPRNLAWSMKLARSEFQRAESLPESSRANRLVALMDAREERDALRATLRDVVDSYADPRYTAEDFGKVIDCARETLADMEKA